MAYVNAEREHLIELVTETGKMYKALSLELDEAKAEIERLREALFIIASMTDTDSNIDDPIWVVVARAALEEKE